jgi:hypothetical protein
MTAPPEYLADRPALEDAALGLGDYGQPHDMLSELLRSVRLSGERIVAYAPPRTFSVSFADIGTLRIIENSTRRNIDRWQHERNQEMCQAAADNR